MNRKSLSHPQSFRKTSLALAITATLALPVAFAAPGDPVGGEFKVSTTMSASFSGPDVAVDADGDALVVWTADSAHSVDGSDIRAQRYNNAGVAVGAEFRVNTTTAGAQSDVAVAMDAQGNALVVWNDVDSGRIRGIHAQRYNSAGVAVGTEFIVKTNAFVYDADVGMDADGDALVTWTSISDSGSYYLGGGDIFAQRYNSAGVAVGSEFRVNTNTTDQQEDSAVAMDADGDAWVTWYSVNPSRNIYAQRYNSAGVATGTEFRVSSTEGRNAAVALDADGDAWVTWDSANTYNDPAEDVYARRFNNAGVAVGTEFRVNTFLNNRQINSAVALDADGDAFIVWDSYKQDGSTEGIYAQRYNNAGVMVGAEFRVNTSTFFQQKDPAVAVVADGDALVVWTGISAIGTDSFGFDVYAQRYAGSNLGAGVTCDGRAATLVGTNGPNTLIGTSGDDVIAGLDGDDVIHGRGGNDRLCGGHGWDRLLGGLGNDRLIGGRGIDTAEFGGSAGVGASLASGTAGGEGSDTLIEIENLTGTAVSDNLAGNGGPNILRGAGGSDILRGLGGNDRLFGGSANDNMDGGADTDVCDGQDGTSDTASNCETVQNVP